MADKKKHYKRHFDALVELEGEMFNDEYYKPFLFLAVPCRSCKKCRALEDWLSVMPWEARPSMEACAIDVFQTARDNAFFIQPRRERNDTNNEYCLLMVD